MPREVRPRFEVQRDEAVDVLLARIDLRLRSGACPLSGYVAEDRAVIYVPPARQRLWSAELRIHAVRRSDVTVLEGVYAPHPHVWITYVIALAAVVVGITGVVVFALVQWSMNQPPWALYALLPLLLLGAAAYSTAFVGQGFATDEMDELRAFLDAALEAEAGATSRVRNARPLEDEGSNALRAS